MVNQLKSALLRKQAAVGGALLSLGFAARAAVPAEIETGLADMKTDGVSMATMVLLAVIAVAAILFLKKAMGR